MKHEEKELDYVQSLEVRAMLNALVEKFGALAVHNECRSRANSIMTKERLKAVKGG